MPGVKLFIFGPVGGFKGLSHTNEYKVVPPVAEANAIPSSKP